MIRLVGGLPGSGKSYFAANFISEFGHFDGLYNTFILDKDIKVFTNLDDLQIQHDTLESCFQRYGGPEGFFTVANFTKIREHWPKAHLLVIIDEAQRVIDDDLLKNKDVAFFFQYHRHLGVDIFLLTNDIASCSRKVVQLCEFVIEAQPRSKSIPGVFRYKFLDTKGTFLYSKSIRHKPEVFSIYKSFTTDESEKPKNVIKHWVITGAAVLFVFVIAFKMFTAHFTHKNARPVSASKLVSVSPSANTKLVLSKPPVVVEHVSAPARRAAPVRLSPVQVKPLPSPVVEKASPVQSDAPEWKKTKVESMLSVNEHVWFRVSGHLVDGKSCRDYDEDAGYAMCVTMASGEAGARPTLAGSGGA